MDTKHWSIKQHLDYWLQLHSLDNIASVGATRGSRCAELWLLNESMTNKEFVTKYGTLETEYFIGYLTCDTYPYKLIVSFKRK